MFYLSSEIKLTKLLFTWMSRDHLCYNLQRRIKFFCYSSCGNSRSSLHNYKRLMLEYIAKEVIFFVSNMQNWKMAYPFLKQIFTYFSTWQIFLFHWGNKFPYIYFSLFFFNHGKFYFWMMAITRPCLFKNKYTEPIETLNFNQDANQLYFNSSA